MRTRLGLRHSPASAAPSPHRRWRRSAALLGALSLVLISGGAAFADSPDPQPGTAFGHILPTPGPHGGPVLELSGQWAWPTHRSDCNTNRFAAGYAIDWHDSAPGQQGYLITGKDKAGNPISARVGTQADPYTHYNKDSLGHRCGTFTAAGYNVGSWGPITHEYPAGTTTFKACVVTYDLHEGNATHPVTGESGINAADTLVSAHDNSIQSNGNTPGGNQCADVVINPDLKIDVDKTNNADGKGDYHQTETAPAVKAEVPFKVVIGNPSTVSETIMKVTDTFSGSTINVCNGTTGNNVINTVLAPGGSVTCTFTLQDYAPPAGTDKSNTIDVTLARTSNLNDTISKSSVSVVHTSDAAPSLRITKTGPTNGTSGKTGTYTLLIENTGTAIAPAPLTVVDTLDNGETFVSSDEPSCFAVGLVVTCPINASLAPLPASRTLHVTVRYAANATGILTDCATVNSSKESCWPTDLTPPLSLTVVKTNDANLDGSFTTAEAAKTAQQQVQFHALITNNSTVAVTLDSVRDAFGTTNIPVCAQNTTLAANGGSTLCDFTLGGYAPATGSLLDTVTAIGHESTDTTNTVTAFGSSTVLAPGSPELTVVKSGPSTAVAGDEVSYGLKVHNSGGLAAAPIVVTDRLPSGETYVSASGADCSANTGPGQTVTCTLPGSLAHDADATFTVTVRFAADASGPYTDCAKVDGSGESCVTTNVFQPDLSIVKDGPDTTLAPGDDFTYTMTVQNTGVIAAKNFVVSDTLASGLTLLSVNPGGYNCAGSATITCTFPGTLNPGGRAAFSIRVHLADDYGLGSVANTGVVGPTDKTPDDNTSTVLTPVQEPGLAPPDLGIVKKGPASAAPGGTVTYTLTVTNTGTVATSNFTVTDPLANGLEFVSAGGSGWTCVGPGVSCTHDGSLAAGASSVITVVTTLADGFKGTEIRNTATVGPTDGTPGDNTSTAVVPVVQPGTPITGTPEAPTALPFTGSNVNGILLVGSGLLVLGLVVLTGGRRRTGFYLVG